MDWENDDALDDVINNNIQASEPQEKKLEQDMSSEEEEKVKQVNTKKPKMPEKAKKQKEE